MKTLDEIIDTFEKACDLERRCEGCSGCLSHDYGCPNDGAESIPDALHYLKEYQKVDSNYFSELHNIADAYFLQAYREDKDELTALRAFWKEQHENAPLTWDELKAMTGKPVWVHEYDPIDDNKGWHRCRWYLVNFVNDTYFYVYDMDGVENYFDLSDYGKTWTAYRKEKRS